jgi:hypothetical protein
LYYKNGLTDSINNEESWQRNYYFYTWRQSRRHSCYSTFLSDLRAIHCSIIESESTVDSIITFISKNTSSTDEKSAECLLNILFLYFEETFVSLCIEKGLKHGKTSKKMDIISTEAMSHEANINNTNARILFRHLKHFFGGRSYFESKQKHRNYFGDNDFPPIIDRKVLANKTVIPFWYKRPDLLLQSQLKNMIDAEKLKYLSCIDIVIGGDHGGGKFRMTMKVNIRLNDKKSVSFLTQIASVSFSKDDIDILGIGLRLIAEGGRFIVDENLGLSFSAADGAALICSCSMQIYLAGDLKNVYAEISRRNGMSSYWFMWCILHPSEWITFGENIETICCFLCRKLPMILNETIVTLNCKMGYEMAIKFRVLSIVFTQGTNNQQERVWPENYVRSCRISSLNILH